MNKFISILFLATTLTTTFSLNAVHAQDNTAPSAPNVVAPSQPAAVQNTNPAAVAAGTTATGAAPQQPSMMGMALPFVVMLTIMYFLMIRPQQKKMKEHQNLLGTLKAGDEVVTTSGIIGTVSGLTEKVVTIEVSKNVQMKFMKSQVNQILKGNQDLQA